jgi:hypothetical protein
MEKQKYFEDWSKKLSISVIEIDKEFNSILSEEKTVNPKLSLEEQETRSLTRLSLIYKKRLRSPAVGFEGIILGAEDTRDLIAKKRRDAINLYKSDPQSAVAQGITDENGLPLDVIQVFSTGRVNPNYGNPLPDNSFMRRIFGVAIKMNGEEPKFFSLNLQGKDCEKEIPIMKPIKFMAIDRSDNQSKDFLLNASSFTEFKVDENIKLPPLTELINSYLGITKLSEIQDYHNNQKDNYNRIVAIKGTVSILNLEPTSIGNLIMQIEDTENLLDLDAKSLTCWIPGDTEINFSEGDSVIVIGRTNQSKLKDKNGNLTEELGDISLNVFGICPISVTKLPCVDEIKEI